MTRACNGQRRAYEGNAVEKESAQKRWVYIEAKPKNQEKRWVKVSKLTEDQTDFTIDVRWREGGRES